jgi:PAS domain S-box-containing protein
MKLKSNKISELEKKIINLDAELKKEKQQAQNLLLKLNNMQPDESESANPQYHSQKLEELKEYLSTVENQLRLITKNAKDIIFRFSLISNKYEYINPAAYNILEYTIEEFYAKPDLLESRVLENWRGTFKENYEKLLANVRHEPFEYQVYTKSNDIIWLYQNWSLILDKNGKPVAIEGTITDITNRKLAELSLKKKNIEYLSLNEEYKQINENLRNSNKQLIKKNEALVRSEDQYKVLIDQAADGIFIGDANGILLNVNNSGVKMTGYTIDELIGSDLTDLFHKTGKSQKSVLLDHSGSGKAHTSERILVRKDKSKVPVEINIKMLSDGRFHAIFRDISERLEAEEQLRQNEIRFRSLFENMGNNVAIFEVMDDGKDFIFKNFNSAAEKLEKVHRTEIIGKSAALVFPTLVEYKLLESFRKVWKTGEPESTPIIVYDNDGMILSWTENFIYKLPSNEIVVIYDDITERKKAEYDLLKTKERYRIATKETMVAVWERNLENNKGHADPVLFEILGYPIPEVEDSFSVWKNYIHPEDLAEILKQNKELKDGKIKEINIKFRATHKNGNIRWFVDKGVALRNESGKAIKLIGTISDITQQQKIEEQLILAKEKAEEADNLKSTFLANMSHEIRTPMNGILGFSDLLRSEETTEQERKNYIEIIYQSGKQLLNIINDILDISKIEVGQIQINQENCSLNEILDELSGLLKPKTIDKKDLKLQVHKELSDSESFVITDGFRVRQILTNLINNAIKFTTTGYVEFGYFIDPVDEHLEDNQAFIQFFIKDTGIGIPESKREIIFDRFRQSDESHTRKFGGTGLGLAISKGFVELLGGKIWHESMEKSGSTFYFTIPYIAGEPGTIQKIEAKLSSKYQWKNRTILVVEDDETSYKYLYKILRKAGLQILRAVSGYEAITLCDSQRHINMVLMDIQLPGLNGYQATQRIKEIRPELPIIAQTAHAMPEDKQKSLDAGCDDYISKPIKRQLLLSKIDQLINKALAKK